jgi:hypothetical protein
MSIPSSLRSAAKPECISAETERAFALNARSVGHSFAAGAISARYSQMASESQTRTAPSVSAGTRPDGECGAIFAFVSGSSSVILISWNGMFATFAASHGRRDQDEWFLLATISVSSDMALSTA